MFKQKHQKAYGTQQTALTTTNEIQYNYVLGEAGTKSHRSAYKTSKFTTISNSHH